jgi:hypothetical protein
MVPDSYRSERPESDDFLISELAELAEERSIV